VWTVVESARSMRLSVKKAAHAALFGGL
jgi:hypothetical protein